MNFKQKELEGNDGDGGKHLPADLKLKQSGAKREKGDMKWRILPPPPRVADQSNPQNKL